jgi:predicted neuraminidase
MMKKELIFEASDQFNGCHAATLVFGYDGNIISAWFAGSHEGNNDVAIWLSRRVDNSWESPRKVAKINNQPHWNPVLFNSGDGFIYLYFKTGKTIPGWITWVMHSSDNGQTWSEPLELVNGDRSGGRGPVKNKPIILDNGTWLAPASVEITSEWKVFCDMSIDKGESWTKSNLICFENKELPGKGVIQPTLWESEPGQVHMLMRSTCGKICRSDSVDNGASWSQARETTIPNNNSGIDLTKLDDGTLVLIYNPTDNNLLRTPLTLALSTDNGNSWNKLCDIEDEKVEVGHLVRQDGGEFSYPSIISNGNNVFAVYTCHRKYIAFVKIKIK